MLQSAAELTQIRQQQTAMGHAAISHICHKHADVGHQLLHCATNPLTSGSDKSRQPNLHLN